MARKRRPFGFFDIFEEFEEEMRRMMEEDIEELREREPIVYGFNLRVGPEGKPLIQQFGNVRPGRKGPEISESREPLIDVIEREEDVTVMAELPGVEKERIKLNATEGALELSAVTSEGNRFEKRVELPAKVVTEGAKAHYKNGVLEVVLKKARKSKPKGEAVRIE